MTSKITTLLSKGIITLGTTENKNEFVLFIIGSDKQFAVPFVKTKSTTFAYIDTEISVEDFSGISNIIELINKEKVYKSINTFKPIYRTAPEHSHIITDFISGNVDGVKSVQPKTLYKVVKELGYVITEATLDVETTTRDYSELLAEADVMANFKKDEAELLKVGATYEGLCPEIKVAYEAIEKGRFNGLILQGPTGTGKSFVARILANKAKAPLLNLQITNGTVVEDLVGSYVPNDKGGFDFIEGPLLKAYHLGYQLVVEEINYGQAGINAVLNQFTDGTNRVVVNGRTYHRHPNFVVYMTMNPGYEGTDPLNVALKNRFAKVDVPALTKKEFSARAMAYSKGLGHQLSCEFFGALFDFANLIEKEANGSKWHENAKFSIRNAQRLCDVILLKKRNFDEFFAAIATQYINDLSCDNDNSDKLQTFKKERDVIEQVKAIYELYDFAEITTVEVTTSLDSLFAEDAVVEEETSGSSGSKASEDMVDDLLKRFDL